MKYNIHSVKGMHDHLPLDARLLNKIENIFKKILFNYHYSEIRLPILEKTDLFQKSIGQITDIIGKEMYSFNDKNGHSLTLRPEGTAGCVRSVIQNNLLYHNNPKLWYSGPMFRYERPQTGRYRQFNQLGIETFGFSEPYIELELITIINKFFKKLQIDPHVTLEINCIGSIQSRIQYQKKLKNFLNKNIHLLDKNCIYQLYNNPLRILDSKKKNIQKLLLNAPILINYIDKKSKFYFHQLCYLMNYFNIKYTINYRLVRGLDYYNNTVFEWKTKSLGTQNTICAGGRYDALVQQLGGPSTPSCGLAIGVDRLLLLLKKLSIFQQKKDKIDIYIFFSLQSIQMLVFDVSEKIRNYKPNLKISLELKIKPFKKILKNIVQYKSKIILFLGEKEVKSKRIIIYNTKNQIYKVVKMKNIFTIINSIFL
ncbi:Histidine--tRNA ligase [Buchnera aphidicola (Pterocallis alni)]|uniref:histidine--tRNA ligase n=1 Tax=Buchnera aphidicola TaxID=9 RepID=UPI003464CF22